MENENIMNGDSGLDLKPRKMMTRNTKRRIFYIAVIALFIVETCIFYIGVNMSTFLLAFQAQDSYGTDLYFVGLRHFETILKWFARERSVRMIGYSFLMYGFHIGIGTPLALFLSYYVYKKMLFGGFFRVILFLPSIMSAVVMVTLYKYMVTDVYMELFEAERGLLSQAGLTPIITVIVYNLWMGYGTDVLLYSGAMSGINDSTIEAANLDGCNALQEFWFITIPSIFPTLITFIVTGIAHIPTNQMALYTFFGDSPISGLNSIGYEMYRQNLHSDGLVPGTNYAKGFFTYQELSAMSLIITAVTVPVVLTGRYLLNKFGPSVD